MNLRNAVAVQTSNPKRSKTRDDTHRLRTLVAQLLMHHDQLLSVYARQLFDSVAQQLAGIQFELAAVDHQLHESGALAALTHPRANISALIDEVRALSETLHPGILERGGLPTALRKLARKLSRSRETAIEVLADDIGPKLAPVSAIVLYDAAVAALDAAVAHDSAFPILVTLRFSDGNAMLELSTPMQGVNDAFGFNRDTSSRPTSNLDMLRLLGGTCALRTDAGGATIAVITVACSPAL